MQTTKTPTALQTAQAAFAKLTDTDKVHILGLLLEGDDAGKFHFSSDDVCDALSDVCDAWQASFDAIQDALNNSDLEAPDEAAMDYYHQQCGQTVFSGKAWL